MLQSILNQDSAVKVQLDPTKCGLGEFLKSEQGRKLLSNDDAAAIVQRLKRHHNKLHKSAQHVNRYLAANQYDDAIKYFRKETRGALKSTRSELVELKHWANKRVEGVNKARKIFTESTTKNLSQIQDLLRKMVDLTSKNVMTDEELLKSAVFTQVSTVVLSVVALVVAIAMSVFIVASICGPLVKIINSIRLSSQDINSASNTKKKRG